MWFFVNAFHIYVYLHVFAYIYIYMIFGEGIFESK
jgi:hypothetical protein